MDSFVGCFSCTQRQCDRGNTARAFRNVQRSVTPLRRAFLAMLESFGVFRRAVSTGGRAARRSHDLHLRLNRAPGLRLLRTLGSATTSCWIPVWGAPSCSSGVVAQDAISASVSAHQGALYLARAPTASLPSAKRHTAPRARSAQNQTFNDGNRAAQDAHDYPSVFGTTATHAWFYNAAVLLLPAGKRSPFLS